MPTAYYRMYKLLCQKAGKSASAVAGELGLSNSTVTTWKQGTLPRGSTLKKVADYFGVSADYLMGTTVGAVVELAKIREEAIKPCPFCGCDAEIKDWTSGYESGTYILCKTCGACISEGVEDGDGWRQRAIKKWNRRVKNSQTN